MASSKEVMEALWRIGSIRVDFQSPFTLSSGRTSSLYVDCRRLLSYPLERRVVVEMAAALADSLDVEVIGGAETAGIPLAAMMADRLALPMVYVRKRAKSYGMAAQVEGVIPPGASALLVDDLITNGASKQVFVDGLRRAGARVEHCLVILDREQGGREYLEDMGVQLHSLAGLQETLALGVKLGRMKAEEKERLQRELGGEAG